MTEGNGTGRPVSSADDSTATMLHVDMDAFFASVELLEYPELQGQPVIVGHRSGRSVVTSANYEARSFGLRSAMPVTKALRLCPKAIVLEPHMERYRYYSAEVMRIFRDVTPLVEQLSVDEAFLDVSGARRLLGSPARIGAAIRERVQAETGLTCSVGAASTKFIAKMASSKAKPDGILVISAADTLAFLHPLPVKALWGVGGNTEQALNRLGITTVGDVASTPLATLQKALGNATGHKLHDLSQGIDLRPVVTQSREKSIGHEVTFEYDQFNVESIRKELLKQSDQVAVQLRRAGLVGRTVALKLRFADFTTISRSHTLAEPTDLGRKIYDEVCRIFDSLGFIEQRVRLVGVRVENLTEAAGTLHQPSLWNDENALPHGWRSAEVTIDRLREKFGKTAVQPAALVEPAVDTAAVQTIRSRRVEPPGSARMLR